jgi:hypothetical protein
MKNAKIFLITAFCIFSQLQNAVFAQEKKKQIQKITSSESAEKVEEKLESEPAPSYVNEDELKVHSLGVGIGQTFLGNDFKDNGDSSITGDLYYNYSASHSFDLLVNGHYSSHKIGAKKTSLKGTAIGIKGKFYQFDSFAPFVVGGLGFYAPQVTRELNGTLKKSESKLVFGSHLGFGADLRLNRHTMIGVIFHYHNPFDIKQELDPEIEGHYYKLLITAFYSF